MKGLPLEEIDVRELELKEEIVLKQTLFSHSFIL
ncbi:hypothetical protein DEU39_0644 [Chryseobacterium sp. AG363]|nr:hypothetical protein DEU39_0644 [Chryseobacterium sp. AG363]